MVNGTNLHKISKYDSNFKFSIMTPLSQWLPGATNGIQG